MASPRIIAMVVALPFVACGGSVLSSTAHEENAEADAAVEGCAPREGDDAATAPDSGEEAAAPDAAFDGSFDGTSCGHVTIGCIGAASCGANSAPMPLGCTGEMTCEDFCRARTQCSSPMQCRTDGGTFYCYTCNP